MAATFSPIGEPYIATGRRWLPEARARLAAAVRGRQPDPCPTVTQHQDATDALARATSRAKAGRP
ncbi:hypothetical protein KSP35_13185 [Aquihabitans sp. G128]|uniref:hypothetical protein n=1 Tax=Aquihabitans sp. G128 TaxID=2849779 RepID=UPI001C2165DA|nr:hypothetical protein [Aquihabitans sp. G128]QXC59357.1 hypothetical protein KSP35_13185 [Aquihabitans sp. G128]